MLGNAKHLLIISALLAESTIGYRSTIGSILLGNAALADNLQGSVQQNTADTKSGMFELQAGESNLLWEKWHKRICKELSHRTDHYVTTLARVGFINLGSNIIGLGKVSATITVTRDEKMTVNILSSTGSERLAKALEHAVSDLDGKQVLTFPPQSRRQAISFTYDYSRGFTMHPGMHWIKDDVEQIPAQSDAAR